MPYSPVQKSCIKLKDSKGKSAGLMVEGSAAYMSALHAESAEQEKKDLLKDMPVDDKASALEMGHEDSPAKNVNKGYGYEVESPATFTGMSGGSAMKMGHESPAKQTDERGGSGNSNVDSKGHYGGTRLHYKDKKYDKSVREMFEDSFKTAKAAGAKTFDFHHSGVKDPKTGIYKFKGGTYTTETKK